MRRLLCLHPIVSAGIYEVRSSPLSSSRSRRRAGRIAFGIADSGAGAVGIWPTPVEGTFVTFTLPGAALDLPKERNYSIPVQADPCMCSGERGCMPKAQCEDMGGHCVGNRFTSKVKWTMKSLKRPSSRPAIRSAIGIWDTSCTV